MVPDLQWLDKKPDTFRYHVDHPGENLTAYTRTKRLALGQELLSKKRIYLDTNHWLHLRDVWMDRSDKPILKQIFERLKDSVDRNQVVCPVSYSVFVELMTQKDVATRLATAKVIDLFSKGSCIQPLDDVIKRETLHFVRRCTSPSCDLYSVAEMVWTKSAFILGDMFLQIDVDAIPENAARAMEKAHDDLMWATTFEEQITMLADRPFPITRDTDEFANELTSGKMANCDFDTFEDVFFQELAGGLECYYEMFGELLLYEASRQGFKGTADAAEVIAGGKNLARLLYNSIKLRGFYAELPSLHIPAGLHAAIRFDKNRKYKPGDCEDFRHATLALPYFNVFCTDDSLKHLLCHMPLEYDSVYSTWVVSSDQEVLDVLAEL